MSFKVEQDKNNVPRLIETLEAIKRTEVHIGIFGGEDSQILIIASANEFGCHIKPRRAKKLTVPLNDLARKSSARDIPGLFIIKSRNKKLFLARKGANGGLELMYWLADEIVIPERSFMRGYFDDNGEEISEMTERLFDGVLTGDITADMFFELLGTALAGAVQKYLIDLKTPANSPLTKRLKHSSNPLVDTGRLAEAITYRVVKK